MRLELKPEPLALWPTPWLLRLFGAPEWRFRVEMPVMLYWYSGAKMYKTRWVYVDKKTGGDAWTSAR